MQRMGPGYYFAKTILEKQKGITLGLVVNARGGSKIAQWKKGSKFYKDAMTKVQAAMKTGTLKAIIWHQGESDQKNPKYLEELSVFINNLRTDLKMPKLPFIAGQVNNVPLINDMLAKLPSKVKNTSYIKSEGLKCTDRWHFDSASVQLMGERYAAEVIKLVYKK